jgi:glycosyltransferase involved in cell wall biosynthesis
MARSPEISIITVVFNPGADFVKTVQSVANQAYKNIEFIIVDGGSTDGTVDFLEGHPGAVTKWISEPDKGIYDAMNKGIGMATGEYITFLNAGDCYTSPEVVSELFSDLPESMPHLVYGDVILVWNHSGRTTYQKSMAFTRENLLRWTTQVVCHQSLFVRRDIAPLYDTRWRFKSELNWYFDLVEKIPDLRIHYKQIPIVNYDTRGKGQQNFWSNMREMILLVKERFGWWTLVKYNYFLIIFLKLFYRFRWRRLCCKLPVK